jgi:hypothetical protein
MIRTARMCPARLLCVILLVLRIPVKTTRGVGKETSLIPTTLVKAADS